MQNKIHINCNFSSVCEKTIQTIFPNSEIFHDSLGNYPSFYVSPINSAGRGFGTGPLFRIMYSALTGVPTYMEYNSFITRRSRVVTHTAKLPNVKAENRFIEKCIKHMQNEVEWMKNRKRQIGIENIVKNISSMTATGAIEKVFGRNPFKTFDSGDLEWVIPKKLNLPGNGEAGRIHITNSKQEGKPHRVSLAGAAMTTEQLEKFLVFIKDIKLINDIQE